jgi:hypothetical protein
LKGLAAILFLFILVFNFYGYRLFISCMQMNSDASLEKQVDGNDYDQARLISIKTKLDLPYYTSSPEYQRAYGSIVLNGIHYEYVKRRVYNDTLELLCLPNDAKTKMQSVSNEIIKTLADNDASTPKKNTTIKITLPDFCQAIKSFSLHMPLIKRENLYDHHFSLTAGYSLKHKKPPQDCLYFIS